GWLSARADLILIPPSNAGEVVVARAGKRVVDPTRALDCAAVVALLLFAFGLVLTATSEDGEHWLRGGPVSIADGALFSFRGRVSRSSFWSVVIPILLFNITLGVIGAALIPAAAQRGWLNPGLPKAVYVFLLAGVFVVSVAGTWIAFATYAKRWHDLGRSGWLSLTLLIPVVSLLVFGYLGFSPGTPDPNRCGE
ncbi:MAG: DUF805 domain-containing protein, partial [Acidobacteria bacterium]|nr:DUF805 domain-containing protein [Acidobacteriota bacterium]